MHDIDPARDLNRPQLSVPRVPHHRWPSQNRETHISPRCATAHLALAVVALKADQTFAVLVKFATPSRLVTVARCYESFGSSQAASLTEVARLPVTFSRDIGRGRIARVYGANMGGSDVIMKECCEATEGQRRALKNESEWYRDLERTAPEAVPRYYGMFRYEDPDDDRRETLALLLEDVGKSVGEWEELDEPQRCVSRMHRCCTGADH